MKKLFICLAAALLAVNVNAAKGDLVLSGSLGFATGDNGAVALNPYTGELTSVEGTTFEIAPSLTYFVTDKIGVGAGVNFTTNSPKDGDAATVFGFDVFGRYYLLNTGKFGIFGQATLGFGFANEQLGDYTAIDFSINPGVQYFINKAWSVELGLANVLQLTSLSPKDGDSTTNFGVALNPFDVSFAPLSLTLNYHF